MLDIYAAWHSASGSGREIYVLVYNIICQKKYLQSNGTISYSIELLPMPANRVVCRFLKMPMLAHTKAGLNDLTRR